MILGMLAAVLSVADPAYPVCNAAVCPERTNDLVWENDKFGMRAYGPGEYHRWSGFDVFNKNTASNVCICWTRDVTYNRPGVSPNFHQNHGEGMDNYTMGAARGVGGIAMFADGEWKTYPDWETSRIIHTGPDYCEFEFVYPAFSAAGKMTCHVTLKRGERFFRNDVSFERMPESFVVGPGIDLEPKRDHHGSLVETATSVSLFEDPKGKDGAEGSTMSAVFVAPGEMVEVMTDHLNCRVLGFRGRKSFTYWAGASWSLAGEITTAAAWHACVRTFAEYARTAVPATEPTVWPNNDLSVWRPLEVKIRSTADGTLQPSFFHLPTQRRPNEKVPLLVFLHTWSYAYTAISTAAWGINEAEKRGWAFLYPHFRGPNWTPAACGSDLAVQDIVDAVKWAIAGGAVDPDRVYLIGGSGGGYMALLQAGRHPELWAAVYAACPPADLALWHAQCLAQPPGNSNRGYAKNMVDACGGTPAERPAEYAHRSATTHLDGARQVPIQISTGIHDGHVFQGAEHSVPPGQSVHCFNRLADPKDRIAEEDIAVMDREERVPEHLLFRGEDPFFKPGALLFSRISRNVRLTLHAGGHAGNYPAALAWFEHQRRGQPVTWTAGVRADGELKGISR